MTGVLIADKDEVTEQLRQMINRRVPDTQETNRAEASLCTLSFQSLTHPERHVWLEVDAAGAAIDLEDWTIASEADNAIVRTVVESFEEAIEILQVWLSGANLTAYYTNINLNYEQLVKKAGLLASEEGPSAQ